MVLPATKRDYGRFFESWRWEWFVTLTFKNPVRKQTAIKELLNWNRQLCKQESIQTAFIAVVNCTNWIPHIHVLMLGINKKGENLLNISTKNWQQFWSEMEKTKNRQPRRALIEWVMSNQKVSHYMAKNIVFWNPELCELHIYNLKLLKKHCK
jgi:hypothetical protein